MAMLLQSKAPQSITVTVLAWLGIVSGGFGCLAAATTMFTLHTLPTMQMLIGAPAALAASIGLRNRRNWARLSYIAVLSLGVANILVRGVQQGARGPGIVFMVLGVGFNAAVATKLMTSDVREEFEEPDA